MPAPMPTNIVVGTLVYTVHCEEGSWKELDAHENQFGLTNHMFLTIHLNPWQALRQKADTLLHEVLHCMMQIVAIRDQLAEAKKDVDKEEIMARSLSPVLLMVIRDNPQLLAFLESPIDGPPAESMMSLTQVAQKV